MKKVVHEREEIEYDFSLTYYTNGNCPYEVGDEVASPVQDDEGMVISFCGAGFVVYTESWRTKDVAEHAVYVKTAS